MPLFEIRFCSSHHLAREFNVRISHSSRNWHGIDYSRRKHTSVSTPLVSDQIVYSTFNACYLSFIHYISIIPFYPFIVLPPRCCMLRQFVYEVPTEPAHDIVIHPSPHVGMTQQWTSPKNSATAVDSCDTASWVCFQAGLVYCVVFTLWYCYSESMHVCRLSYERSTNALVDRGPMNLYKEHEQGKFRVFLARTSCIRCSCHGDLQDRSVNAL